MNTQGDLIISNTRVVTPTGTQAACGEKMNNLTIIDNAVIVITAGKIAYIGPVKNIDLQQISLKSHTRLDAHGGVSLPGFIDSHTHLVFGGFRPDEFEWRLKGESYMSIMERGGGIQSTVNATRSEHLETLITKSKWFLDRMIEMGVTTVEAKSGYGLNFDSELKMLQAIKQLRDSEHRKLDIVSTFLGAHAVSEEFKGRPSEYIDHIIEVMLPAFKDLADNCDIFCEKNVFEIEDSRKLLLAARKLGYKIKLHADEIVTLGGAELAAELGALSADHLLHVSAEGIKQMSEAGVVATLLPLTAFALREPYAPARSFIEAGGAVALATDLNPGSCFSGSIPLTIALACIYMNMSIEETITALTLNGAAAIGQADSKGSLEIGKYGDVAILASDNYHILPYYVGMNCVKTTIHHGRIVAQNP
ncbi:MAG: imidazolonepropionase [Muribaculaceae bacterium]|nr:imidazolonepropionase [Muribaculaceae bacterium]